MGSTKNVLQTYHAIDSTTPAGDMSVNITSPATSIKYLDNCAIALIFTGTPTGTFAVQSSIDYVQDSQGKVQNPGTWIDIPLKPAPIAAGAPDQIFIDMNQLPGNYVRVAYTATGGVGTLDMYIAAKAV